MTAILGMSAGTIFIAWICLKIKKRRFRASRSLQMTGIRWVNASRAYHWDSRKKRQGV